ncbi:MAG: hypothetical protein ACRDL8_08685, partial [Solirubrobacteraceae bacterium]
SLHGSAATAAGVHAQIYHHALATGFSRGYLVSAGVLVLALILALVVIRVRRADLSGTGPTPLPTADGAPADGAPADGAPADAHHNGHPDRPREAIGVTTGG